LVDTAQAPEWYNERGVGKGIQRYRSQFLSPKNDSVIILTKIHPRSYEEKKMEASITESKKLLNGDENIPIDIVLLHTPYCWSGHCSKEEESVSWQVGWRNLEYSMQAGNILSIGVSNFDIALLKELLNMADLKVSVIQNWMDPFHQDVEVRKYAAQYNIVYMGYSSFGTQWQGKYDGNNPVFSNKILQEIAEKHETSVSAVVLSWLLQENVVAIPRASSVDHIRDNAAPIANGPDKDNLQVFLKQDDIEAIRSLDGTLGTPWD
jgi:alcohol dehydrogenase (NADP+)